MRKTLVSRTSTNFGANIWCWTNPPQKCVPAFCNSGDALHHPGHVQKLLVLQPNVNNMVEEWRVRLQVLYVS